jgi:aldehyde dehydrogenase (NAD+)
MAGRAQEIAQAISPDLARSGADTLVSELLPLLDACRFLEKEAGHVLRTRRLKRKGRPFWLRGVTAEIQRVPIGHVLVIGPSNFPLFLSGVQVLQALAAGNRVTWKPGEGGGRIAELVAKCLREAGLPQELLRVTEASIEAGQKALTDGADKVVFTGSGKAARNVLGTLGERAIPTVAELSGADAVIVLPSADLERAAKGLAFGLRFNGAAVCMSPRRLIADATTLALLRPLLEREMATVPEVGIPRSEGERLRELVSEAVAGGATVRGHVEPAAQAPLLIWGATPELRLARTDIFAPVLAIIEVSSRDKVPGVVAQCPLALTVAIFGDEDEARRLSEQLSTGTVLINDLIVPTADPRVPFGGRGASGYGVTRGAEGLLEMTAIRSVLVRRGRSLRHFTATTESDFEVFSELIAAVHGGGWRSRAKAVRQLVSIVVARVRGRETTEDTRTRGTSDAAKPMEHAR